MIQNRRGFTLIELLVVVLIIGILTAVALPQYTTAVEKSRAAEALTLMSAVAGGVERYRMQKDAWPGSNEFAKLDLDVPTFTSGTQTLYGGKNFQITFEPVSGNTQQFKVIATRRLNNTNSQYKLVTEITEATNGTFSTTRKCTKSDDTVPATSDDSEASKFCYAVTNGHPNSF